MKSLVSFNVFLVLMNFKCPVVNSLMQCLNSATYWHMLSPCYLLYNSTIYKCYFKHYANRKKITQKLNITIYLCITLHLMRNI